MKYYAHSLFCYALCKRQAFKVVLHKHYVGGFYSRVAAHSAHRYAYVRAHKHGCVVYSVARKANYVALALLGYNPLYLRYLVGGKQGGLVSGYSGCLCDFARCGFVVARKHYGARSHSVQLRDYLGGFILKLVGYQNAADIFAVTRYVHRGACRRYGSVLYAVFLHKLFIAAQHLGLSVGCEYSLSAYVRQGISAVGLSAVCGYYRLRYRVRGALLRRGGKPQYLLLALLWIYRGYRKIALCKRTRLVEYEYVCFGKPLKIVGALNKYVMPGACAYSGKEGQGN